MFFKRQFKRTLRVNELIKRELGKIIVQEIELPVGSFLTIDEVEINNDLNEAKVELSVFPSYQKEKIIIILENQKNNLQRYLNKKINLKTLLRIRFKTEKNKDNFDKEQTNR